VRGQKPVAGTRAPEPKHWLIPAWMLLCTLAQGGILAAATRWAMTPAGVWWRGAILAAEALGITVIGGLLMWRLACDIRDARASDDIAPDG